MTPPCDTIEAMEAERDALREALRFYADYHNNTDEFGAYTLHIEEDDCGKTAKEALQTPPQDLSWIKAEVEHYRKALEQLNDISIANVSQSHSTQERALLNCMEITREVLQ